MPALRKRQSRTGTPYDTPNDTPPRDPESRRGKAQSSLDSWVEPPPKNPTPSFEEHGFARHGVLENMAPLGIPPSNRVKQQLRASGNSITRGSLFGRKANGLSGEEGVSTPEMTPAPELEQEDEEKMDEDDLTVAFARPEEDEDDEYVPKKSKPKAYVAKTPVRGKTPVNKTPVNKTPIQSKTPVRNGSSRPTTAVPSPATQNAPPHPFDPVTKQRTQIAVNAAIDRSNTSGRRSVGYAIRELWNDSVVDTSLAESLHSIMQQNATAKQFTLFKNYIKAKKRKWKKAQQINKDEEANKSSEEQESREEKEAKEAIKSPSSPPNSVLTPPEVILAKTTTIEACTVQDTGPTASAPSQPVDITMEDHNNDIPHVEISSIELAQIPSEAHPFNTAPALSASDSTSPPAMEMPSKSPRKQQTLANSHNVPSSGLSTNAHTPAPKTNDSADSDLSDVNEEIVQNGPPEPVQVNGNGAAVVPKKAKNAALARAGKKSRANSVKPPGKYEKKPPLTAEEIEEQKRLQRRRQELVEEQPSFMDYDPPISDVRFEDEMLETESLTESQIAVGPPVDTNRPRRPGRLPRSGNGTGTNTSTGKRLREGGSAQPSPRLDSAASTRPSTPAIAPPFSKRLKLNNGQAARTKRSPVKNRDGPIAGMPHTTGGGSRQSGPDDNAPDSPPSESDDLCAACKGAGEFVCCDHCPRVFHFYCLDPPREEAPTGSFSCFECTVEHKAVEESADSYSCFGPLFKQLEHTNTRAFALPPDTRNYFEHVSARPDGSYFEDIKKFPLSKNSGYGYQKPDYLKTIDSDHKVILCTQCGKSSGGKRQMLKCDFCSTYWHLDCCDPPLANPPHISLDAAQRDAWKCPRHIDHDFRGGYLLQHDLNQGCDAYVATSRASSAARVPRKVRKARNAEVIEPTFSRGMRNNGQIHVLNNPDDDTDGEGNYVFANEDTRDLNSKVFRVPEKGIVLDFVSKVKHGRIEKQREKQREVHRAAKVAAKRTSTFLHFAARPIEQQQAALNLARLANQERDVGLNDAHVDALISSLTAEAPKEVVSAISNAGPPPTTSQERKELLKLQELIKRRLAALA